MASPEADTIARSALLVPGSLWRVGDEPHGVTWQDDATPLQYAVAYHQADKVLRQADPMAWVAAGGIIQRARRGRNTQVRINELA